jgi:TnpA family transposase
VAEAVLSNNIDIEKDQLVLEALEAEAVSSDLEPTRDAIFGEIGTVQFPELMMEVDSHTRFSTALLGREPSSWEELLSVYGALLAHGTDMSPTGMALMIPQISATAISNAMALLEDSAALRQANDGCVTFTRRHPIARTWGEGTIASADSMSLDATRHLFSARQDYRRGRKAIGIYTRKLDQWPLIYDQPVVLMRRQSGAAIEGMLRQRTGEALERIAVDTHGFTFFGMGLSKGLGFDLCPRLRGIKRQLHVPRGTQVPDILEPVATRDVSMVNIRAGWDGFVRLMASLEAGTLSAVLALDRFGSDSRADPIHKCGTAMGQLLTTLFIL